MNSNVQYDKLGFIIPESVDVVSFEIAKNTDRRHKVNYFYLSTGKLMKTERFDTVDILGLWNCYPAITIEEYKTK